MKLQAEPFAKIKSGIKTIEIRLNDKKRRQLKVGNTIIFTLIDNSLEQVKVTVTKLERFDTFMELFQAYEPTLYGSDNVDEYKSMYKYYSEYDEQKYGVLAIHLQVS